MSDGLDDIEVISCHLRVVNRSDMPSRWVSSVTCNSVLRIKDDPDGHNIQEKLFVIYGT